MKKLIAFLVFSFFLNNDLSAQNYFIEGPTSLCPGECGIYSIGGEAADSGDFIEWFDGPFILSQNSTFERCWFEVALPVFLTAQINNTYNVQIEIQMLSENASDLQLHSDNFCSDEEANCEKVCQGQTVNYSIEETNSETTWDIQGSENYDVNGTIASVTWNEIGEGLVTVEAETPSIDTPFDINCFYINTTLRKIFVNGGVFPIEFTFTDATTSETVTYNSIPDEGIVFTDVFGLINITATDAEGNVSSCNSFSQGSYCSETVEIADIALPTDCSNCNGIIEFTTTGNFYFQWSDGDLTASRNDLSGNNLTLNAGFIFDDVWWAQIEGGVEPYTLTITDYTGQSFDYPFSGTGSIFTNGITPLNSGPGDYIFSISDGVNIPIFLSRTAPGSNTSVEMPSVISSATDCDMCNGVIEFNAIGGGNYIDVYDGGVWVAGGTNLTLDNLCPGEYRAIIFEDITGSPPIAEYPIIIGDNCSETPPATCPISAIQCVQVLPNPEAQFVTLPAAEDNVVEICNEQSIIFQNQSNGAESFIWDFGDFNTSVDANPEHTYANPGTYNVTCIARNDCFCSDTTSLTVNVVAANIPEIECIGTVCVGDTVTYTSLVECDIFAWQISPEGELIEGGGTSDNYVQVLWGTGPVGTVSLSVGSCGTNTLCSQVNVAQIPILSGDAVIEGPAKVCNSTQVIYSIPKYDGTDFQWTVSEFGTITSGENTHQITVLWEGVIPNEAQFVEVVYENCWLECGGNAQMEISIVPEFYIQGVPLICENESSIYYARETANDSPASVNWTVLNAEGISVYDASSSVSVMIPFEFGYGEYTILTTPADVDDYCTATYDLKVQVSELPSEVLAINGQSQICIGETYTYSAQSDLSNPIFTWTINDAGNFSTQVGNTALVTWTGTGPHLISVTQTSADGLDCTSESIILNVETTENINMSGSPTICAESTASYTATDLQAVSYDWSIVPANAGTIVSGNNTNSVEIYWAYGGNATVNLQLCGQTLSQNVNVKALPSPQVIQPDDLCPDQMATITLSQNYQSYLWKDAEGMILSDASTVDLTSGYYEIEVTNAEGCTGNSVFSIGDFSTNSLNISSPSFTSICPAAGIGFPVLYAPELEEGFIYEWFFNNLSLGINASQIQTSEYGTYTVEATNPDGCTVISNGIIISNACGQGPPPPPQTCELDFSFQNTDDCKTFNFMPTSDNVISIVSWNFGDGTTSTEMNPQHTYDEIGLYHIILIANVLGSNGTVVACLVDMPLSFSIVADFSFEENCVGEAVQFNDISLTVGDGDIVSQVWNFGDPASGDNTSNESNPIHVFSAPGTYIVSLTVTDATGCSDEMIKTVSILSAPNVNFISPEQTCAATALPFVADVSSNVVSYIWDFGDPASGNANSAQSQNVWHNYENVGSYNITLTGSDIYGCEDTETQTVVTEANNLSGNIAVSPANTICEGGNVSLTAPEGGTTWQWSTGEITESITVSEAGNYQVSLTSENGCTYIPTRQIIEILPLPTGDIYALELDEFGNPINYIFETHELCYGEDVFLQIEENELYSYEWSTGSTTTEEEFSEDRDNLLEVGITDISVAITDLLTGCSSISSYTVIVHPHPENIVIVSDTPSPICGNSSAVLSVESPVSGLDYIWNTGELGPHITLIAGGEYWVRAINEFGCEGESNHVLVNNAPDINKVPDGCHSFCESDTLCLPILEDIVVYQWYLNGEILTDETANSPNLIMKEEGEYQLFMEDIYGCTSLSDPLNIEIYEGYGAIWGQIWLDVNENGIIDDEDENLTGISIQITDENGLNLDYTSISEGYYAFSNLPTTDYILSLDTLSLPPDVTYTIIENTALLEGCSDENQVDWLLSPFCAPLTEILEIPSCDGVSAFYNEIEILVGGNQNFMLTAFNGCDSILTVEPYIFIPEISSDEITICEDETVDINGQILQVGDVTDVLFSNELGCDSIVTYTVLSANSLVSTDEIAICEDETIEINGQILQVGDVIDISFTNQFGCDSIVTYTALSANSNPINQSIQLCEGESIQIEGTTINAGDTVSIELSNQYGCDSLIIVTAGSLNPDFTIESVQICEGEIFAFQNAEMQTGETQTFTLSNQYGCDSLIEMTVNAFPISTFVPQSFVACPDINDGSFVLENPDGGTPPFEYSLNGSNWQTSPEFTELYSGNYIVQIRDANSCIYEESVEILTAPDLVLITENQTFPCDEEELELSVFTVGGIGNPNILWETGDSTISILISETGVYSLSVSDECYEQSADIEVVRGVSSNASPFYIPNAFSPNFDGMNDEFCPLCAEGVEVVSYRLMIFDRWGNFVFESLSPENCWDGALRNKAMDNAVFVYVLEAEILECEVQKSVFEYGDVTIVQ